MKLKYSFLVVMMIAISFACEQKTTTNAVTNAPKDVSSPVPDLPTTSSPASTPQNGDYAGKGVVTKINMELGSVELNHEAIKDLMPAMTMEFFVSDKKMLDGLNIGDKVDFVIRYGDRNETIVKIAKTS